MTDLTVLGYFAATLGAILAMPQWWRLRSLGDSTGVSPVTWSVAVCAGIMWTGYSIAIASPPLILGNVVAFAGSVAVLVALTHLRVKLRREWLLVAGALLVTVLAVPFNAEAKGWAATAASVLMRLPQLVMTLRTWHSAGLSIPTWVLGVVSAASWIVYGISIGSGPVIVTDAWALLSATVIVGASLRGREKVVRDDGKSQK